MTDDRPRASRPPATRPASASSASTTRAAWSCSPTRSRPRSTSTPASAAWCRRSPPGRTCRRWCPAVHRALATAGVRAARRRRRRGHRRSGAGRRAAGRGRRGQGLRGGLGRAALRGEPPRRARRRRHPAARPAARRAWRCWSPAGTPACSTCPDLAGPGHPARRDDRRRGGRGVRQGGAAARAAVPGRPAHRPGRPATATRRRSRSRAGSPGPRDAPFDFSFSGLKTAVARHVEALQRAGDAGAGGRRRRELPGGRGRRAHGEGRARGPRARDGDAACSAAAWRPTPGCGRWPQERCDAAGIALRVPRPRPVHGQRRDGRRAGRAPAGGRREALARWTCRRTRRCR